MKSAGRWVTLTLAMALLGWTGDGRAQSQWVAYAYDRETGAWGIGWGHATRQGATNMALSNCRRAGCEVQGSELARCVAYASSPSPRASAFGSGNTDALARNNSALFCAQKVYAANCSVQAVRCGQ